MTIKNDSHHEENEIVFKASASSECKECGGSGMMTCPECRGKGGSCDRCYGNGEVPCTMCGGTGKAD